MIFTATARNYSNKLFTIAVDVEHESDARQDLYNIASSVLSLPHGAFRLSPTVKTTRRALKTMKPVRLAEKQDGTPWAWSKVD